MLGQWIHNRGIREQVVILDKGAHTPNCNKERGVLLINIALAYVLKQPFPTFPLIGPRTLAETRTSVAALHIELTPEELRWLNLEA